MGREVGGENLPALLGMSGERSGERRSPCSGGDEGAQQVVCYGDWTGELNLEARRTRG